MEILPRAQQVGQRDKLQQRLRLRTDQRRVDDVRLSVELELLAVRRIEDRRAQRGEIATALGQGRHRRKRVVGSAAARAVPANKEEYLVSGVQNLRNVQRTAQVRAEAQLVVVRFRRAQPAQGIRLGVQSRVVVGEIQKSVWLVYVKASGRPPQQDNLSASRPSTKSASAKAASTKIAKPSRSASLLHSVAEFLRAPLRAADAYRFCWRIRSGTIQRKS